jgi:hypothetical protein
MCVHSATSLYPPIHQANDLDLHDPPLVYNMTADKEEMFPLTTATIRDLDARIAAVKAVR